MRPCTRPQRRMRARRVAAAELAGDSRLLVRVADEARAVERSGTDRTAHIPVATLRHRDPDHASTEFGLGADVASTSASVADGSRSREGVVPPGSADPGPASGSAAGSGSIADGSAGSATDGSGAGDEEAGSGVVSGVGVGASADGGGSRGRLRTRGVGSGSVAATEAGRTYETGERDGVARLMARRLLVTQEAPLCQDTRCSAMAMGRRRPARNWERARHPARESAEGDRRTCRPHDRDPAGSALCS